METNVLLPEAPGAKAARHCGIWAIITAIILCLPVSIVLAIIAIVQNGKAKRFVEASPSSYSKPSGAGLILGIVALAILPVMLMFAGIVAAIAIPAMLGQRARARDKAAISNVNGHFSDLIYKYDSLQGEKASQEATVKAMEAALMETSKLDVNPWSKNIPAFSYTISVVNGVDGEGVQDAAKLRATEPGQGVYVIQFPEQQGAQTLPGYLAGAVKLNSGPSGGQVYVKIINLE
jgi:type II secretory pathway pseudopilin PulG